MRLDAYLVKNSLVSGRDRAKELILSGKVKLNGKTITKPSTDVAEESVSVEKDEGFVGRGAYKLKKAIEYFGINPSGKVCIDCGASTGGFTDVLLRGGAKKVYAVDVGHGQLAQALIADSRVVNAEGTDIRNLKVDEDCSFFACDVSFISLKQVLPALYEKTDETAEGVCLVKPQFEAGRAAVGKKGVVKDKKVHRAVLENILAFATELKLYPVGLTYSPVTGQNGNIEFLLFLKKEKTDVIINAEKTVNEAWEALL